MNKQEILKRMRGIKGLGISRPNNLKTLNDNQNEKPKYKSFLFMDAMENTPSNQFPEAKTFSIGQTSIHSNAPNIAVGKGLSVDEILNELNHIGNSSKRKKKSEKAGFK